MQFPNFEVKRTVDNALVHIHFFQNFKINVRKPKPREIVSETKSKFKITRTVKNEHSGVGELIVNRYSDSDDIEINLKPTKKSKKKKSRCENFSNFYLEFNSVELFLKMQQKWW